MCEKMQDEAKFVNYLWFLSVDTVFRISCHTGSSEDRTKLFCVSPSPNWRQRPNLLYGHPVFGTWNEFSLEHPVRSVSGKMSEAAYWKHSCLSMRPHCCPCPTELHKWMSLCYSLQLPDSGWAVGWPHQADFLCSAPSSGCLTCLPLLWAASIML